MESDNNSADKLRYSGHADQLVDKNDEVVAVSSRQALCCVTSEQLFAGTTEVQISHRGALYRLKQTSLGKLILTK